MGITINANDIDDAANKLGLRRLPTDIRITWRRSDELTDFGRIPAPGCIVDATNVPGEEVKRCFKSSAEAVKYLAALFQKHDDCAKDARAQHAKRERENALRAKYEARLRGNQSLV